MPIRELSAALSPDYWPLLALIAARVSGLMLVMPLFSMNSVPRSVRTGATLLLALILLPLAPQTFPVESASLLPLLVVIEIFIGFSIGLTASVFMAGVTTAGEIIGMKMGLGIASVFDPMSNVTVPIVGYFIQLFVIAVFFLVDGHLVLIQGLGHSVEILSPGQVVPGRELLQGLAAMGSMVFVTAVKISAPVLTALLVANVAFGVLAKAAPQMNVFLLSMPITICLGLLVIGFTLAGMVSLTRSWVFQMPEMIEHILSGFVPRR